MSMAVIVPSRGRPGNIAELIKAWDRTAEMGYAQLHVMIDNDDPEMDAYLDVLRPHANRIYTWIDVRRRLGGSLNYLAPILANNYDMVGFMGDDHRPLTARWDIAIDTAGMKCAGGVVYGNDLIQGANLPTAVFMDSRIVRTLGWFVVPGMTHLFMDNLWKTLGEQLGTLRYLPDVIIEHVHPIAGKAEWDAGYVEANDGAVWAHDEAIYHEWVAFQMPADIAKIRAAL